MVSNNTAISAFAGATSAVDGAIGYIPKPLAGQQNYVLTGTGSWSPSNIPYISFSANVAVSGTMNSSNYPYIYNTVTFNDGSCYNALTGIFTASVRGYYQFHATFTGGTYTWIVKNGVPGTTYSYPPFPAPGIPICIQQGSGSLQLSGIAKLNVGDTVYVGTSASTGSGKNNDFFSGILINPY